MPTRQRCPRRHRGGRALRPTPPHVDANLMEEGRATEQHSPRRPRRRPARGCRWPPRSPPRDARPRRRRGGGAPPGATSTTGAERRKHAGARLECLERLGERRRSGDVGRGGRPGAAWSDPRPRRCTAGSAPTTTHGRLEHALVPAFDMQYGGMPVQRFLAYFGLPEFGNSTSDTPTSPRGWPRSWRVLQE